jgi:condensin complex subunit 2
VTNTLEADEDALNAKLFDLEYAVDPLFNKTAADFDEGGAKGLLLNHLCISNLGKVIFDASEYQPSAADEDEQAECDFGDASIIGRFR